MTPKTQADKTLDELIDELITVTIDNANDWYGVECPHDAHFYDYTVPEVKQRMKALITKARIDELMGLDGYAQGDWAMRGLEMKKYNDRLAILKESL